MDHRKNVYSTQSKLPRPFNNFNKKNNFKKPVSKRENDKHFILYAPKIKIGEKSVIKKRKSFEKANNEILSYLIYKYYLNLILQFIHNYLLNLNQVLLYLKEMDNYFNLKNLLQKKNIKLFF